MPADLNKRLALTERRLQEAASRREADMARYEQFLIDREVRRSERQLAHLTAQQLA